MSLPHPGHAIFDDKEFLPSQNFVVQPYIEVLHNSPRIDGQLPLEHEFDWARRFLMASYEKNFKMETFTSYRRELEKFFQYCWFFKGIRITEFTKLSQVEDYFRFVSSPDLSWVALDNVPRFTLVDGYRYPNPNWKPFVFSPTKVQQIRIKDQLSALSKDLVSTRRVELIKLTLKDEGYRVSDASLSATLTILRSFFRYLSLNEVSVRNPFEGYKLSKTLSHNQGVSVSSDGMSLTRRLSLKTVGFVIELLKNNFVQSNSLLSTTSSTESDYFTYKVEADKAARRYMAFVLIFKLYLRVSELSVRGRTKDKVDGAMSDLELTRSQIIHHQPVMSDFINQDGLWYLKILGKRAKWRLRTVNDEVMIAVKEYRQFRGLSTAYPTLHETDVPIIPALRKGLSLSSRSDKDLKSKGVSTSMLRKIIQECFDIALTKAKDTSDDNAISELMYCTTHWLRHTGISIEVDSGRNLRHIMGESGHNSFDSMKPYMDDDRAIRHSTNIVLK